MLASAATARAQGYDSDGTFVDSFNKQLTQFTDLGSSYDAVASIPYSEDLPGAYPAPARGRTAQTEPERVENFEGIAQNTIWAGGTQTVPPLHGEPGSFVGTHYLNDFLGADRFYGAGVFGTNAVTASIEGGRAWNQHETLLHAADIPQNLQGSQIDRHATWTAMLLAGRPGGAQAGQHQTGIAPLAELHTGGFATGWAGTRYSFAYSFFGNVLFDQYVQPMLTGVTGPGGTNTADVVNSSYVILGEPAASFVEVMLDAMANTNPNAVMVMGVGNNGPGVNTVASPATGYNNIAVSSLTRLTDYETPSVFSSGGDIDYEDPVNGTFPAGRRGVDIAAPGEDLGSAYYGGQTGGNTTILVGPPSGPPGGPNYYTRDLDGTSYATPLVSGGVALMQDAAQIMLPGVSAARDGRVIKAALLNSAHKTTGWDNAQAPHPNGNGGVLTIHALDPQVGTGRMDLDAAFDQYLSGTTDVPGTTPGDQGMVQEIGWDLGLAAEGTLTDYFFDQPLAGGSTLTSTLTWFRDRRIVDTGQGLIFVEDNYADLDLEVWSVANGAPDMLISESASAFNNTEHLSFTLPETGRYMLRVRWFREWFDVNEPDPNETVYGLSWAGVAIPEPASLVLLAIGAIAAFACSRRRAR